MGKALWQIQALEDTLAHLIALVLKLPARASIEEAEAILENVRKETLGRLIKEIKKAIHFTDHFELFITNFVSERNWLIHRSWREYKDVLNKENEYKYLRLRVSRLESDAHEYNELFSGYINDWAKKQGINERKLQIIQKEFLDVWGNEI